MEDEEVQEYREKQEAARREAIRPSLIARLRAYSQDTAIDKEKRARYRERLKQLEGDNDAL